MRRALLTIAVFLLSGLGFRGDLVGQPKPPKEEEQTERSDGRRTDREEGEDGDGDEGEDGVEENDKPKRSQHSRSLTKVRTGSLIHRSRPEEPVVDLRGEHERRRDHEVIRHYRRMAQLDVIAKVAAETGDEQLTSEVEAVRRTELERFRLAMQHLQMVIRTRLQTGLP